MVISNYSLSKLVRGEGVDLHPNTPFQLSLKGIRLQRGYMKQLFTGSYSGLRSALDSLDLSAIKFKLMDKEEGKGWDRVYADMVESQYRRFLFLTVTAGATIGVTADIDAFWHAHILDTMKYAEDCQSVFGFFLHHFPYFGMRGEQDAHNLMATMDSTKQLWEDTFGEPLVALSGKTCGTCGGSCSACSAITPASEDLLKSTWRPTLA